MNRLVGGIDVAPRRRNLRDTGTVTVLVRVNIALPVLEHKVFEDDRPVIDSPDTWVVLVHVGLQAHLNISTSYQSLQSLLLTWVMKIG